MLDVELIGRLKQEISDISTALSTGAGLDPQQDSAVGWVLYQKELSRKEGLERALEIFEELLEEDERHRNSL